MSTPVTIAKVKTEMSNRQDKYDALAEPVGINVETFDTEHKSIAEIEAFVRSNYDLTPKGIIESLHLLDVDYNKVSAYGHFGKRELPWEQ